MREHAPAYWDANNEIWAFTRYDDVLAIEKDPVTYSSQRAPRPHGDHLPMMISMDGQEHRDYRNVTAKQFTPRMVQQWEAKVQRITREILDEASEKGACDFVTEISAPFPIRIICEMMGIPESQHAFVFEQTNIILGAGDPEYVAEGADVMLAFFNAGAALAELMKDLARTRQATPTEDLTSVLVHADIAGDRLTEQELASFFVLLAGQCSRKPTSVQTDSMAP